MTGSIKVRHLGLLILIFVFSVALTGCGGGSVTKENVEKVKTDMAKTEVEKVMGGKGADLKKEDFKKATDKELPEGETALRWVDDSKYLICTFKEDKVVSKYSKL